MTKPPFLDNHHKTSNRCRAKNEWPHLSSGGTQTELFFLPENRLTTCAGEFARPKAGDQLADRQLSASADCLCRELFWAPSSVSRLILGRDHHHSKVPSYFADEQYVGTNVRHSCLVEQSTGCVEGINAVPDRAHLFIVLVPPVDRPQCYLPRVASQGESRSDHFIP